MESLNRGLQEYGRLLKETNLQQAYRGLMQYCLGLHKHFKEGHPEYEVQGNFYQGYLDLTFFTLTTEQAKQRNLKYMIVFNHEWMRFEVWLSGRNRTVMSEYHQKFKDYPMGNYLLTADETGMASIIVAILVEEPDFEDPIQLTNQIDMAVTRFIEEVEHRFFV